MANVSLLVWIGFNVELFQFFLEIYFEILTIRLHSAIFQKLFSSQPEGCQVDHVEVSVDLVKGAEVVSEVTSITENAVLFFVEHPAVLRLVFLI